jgi:hypothetical protein
VRSFDALHLIKGEHGRQGSWPMLSRLSPGRSGPDKILPARVREPT